MENAGMVRMIPGLINTSTRVLESVTKIILDSLAEQRDNKFVNELLEHGKLGGNLDYEICKSFAALDFDVKLAQKGIPHAIIHDKTSGLTAIVTRDIDREAVLEAKNELFVEQKRLTRLSPSEFSRLNKGQNIEIIRGRSPVEAKLFQQVAKTKGLSNISFQKNTLDPEKIDIYYTEADKDKARYLMCKVEASTVGVSGERTAARVAREIEFQGYLMKDVQRSEKDFYVVSQSNPDEYIHFNKDGLEYWRKDKLIAAESRSSERFVALSRTYISSIVSPISFSKSEFEIPKDARCEMIKNVKITPDLSEFNKHNTILEQSAKQLISLKLTLDKSEPTNIPKEFHLIDSSFKELFADANTLSDPNAKVLLKNLDNLNAIDSARVKNFVAQELTKREHLLRTVQDKNLELYVVGDRNAKEYLHFTQNGLEHFKDGAIVQSYSRDSQDFNAIVSERLAQMPEAISLNKEQFEVAQSDLIQNLRREIPTMRDDMSREFELERAARELVELKLSLDNGEQLQIPNSFYNPAVSFSEFVDIEQINDNEAKELIETLDRLEDKEKILIKAYVKDTFQKVESLDIQSAYIDPAINEDELEPGYTPERTDFDPDIDIPRNPFDADDRDDRYED